MNGTEMRELVRQLLRYGFVGLLSNAILYGLYLLLTNLGFGHKLAMTMLFAAGVAVTFVMNKRWTFGHRGYLRSSSVRYVAAYAFGYLVNFAGLWSFVDVMGLRHEFVQAGMLFLVAGLIFVLQKFWVFRLAVPFAHHPAAGKVT